jgi:hypothetical protein
MFTLVKLDHKTTNVSEVHTNQAIVTVLVLTPLTCINRQQQIFSKEPGKVHLVILHLKTSTRLNLVTGFYKKKQGTNSYVYIGEVGS